MALPTMSNGRITTTRHEGAVPGPVLREQQEDNPFAPPPKGAADRPWQPRGQEGGGEAMLTGPAALALHGFASVPEPPGLGRIGPGWSDQDRARMM